jgi:hypothetical protein
MHPVGRRKESARLCVGVWGIGKAWLACKYNLGFSTNVFKSMQQKSSLNLLRKCFSCLFKPTVSLLIIC